MSKSKPIADDLLPGKPPDKSLLVESALRLAGKPLSIDEICLLAFERIDERDRNLVRVVLHRLDGRSELTKHAQTYEIKKPSEAKP
jgi:hypothetical protein